LLSGKSILPFSSSAPLPYTGYFLYFFSCNACRKGYSFRTFFLIIYLAKSFLPENSIMLFSFTAPLEPAFLEMRNIISTTRRAGRVPQVCGRLLLFATQRKISVGHLAFFRFLLLPRSLKLDIFFISLAALLAAWAIHFVLFA
jgi:hypothetical protein